MAVIGSTSAFQPPNERLPRQTAPGNVRRGRETWRGIPGRRLIARQCRAVLALAARSTVLASSAVTCLRRVVFGAGTAGEMPELATLSAEA
jgi:hypothetical protein